MLDVVQIHARLAGIKTARQTTSVCATIRNITEAVKKSGRVHQNAIQTIRQAKKDAHNANLKARERAEIVLEVTDASKRLRSLYERYGRSSGFPVANICF